MNGYVVGGMLASVVLLCGVVLAGCGHPGPGKLGCHGTDGKKHAEWIVGKISKELRLNDTQKTKLNAIKDDLVKKHQEMKPEHEAMLGEVRDQMLNDRFDIEKVDQVFVAKQSKHDEIRKYLIGKLAEFHDLLTPEQRKQLVDKLEGFHKMMESGEK